MKADTTDKKSKWAGIQMTEEELRDWEQVFIDIDENIALVYKKGKNI